jgi:hypothetical protein
MHVVFTVPGWHQSRTAGATLARAGASPSHLDSHSRSGTRWAPRRMRPGTRGAGRSPTCRPRWGAWVYGLRAPHSAFGRGQRDRRASAACPAAAPRAAGALEPVENVLTRAAPTATPSPRRSWALRRQVRADSCRSCGRRRAGRVYPRLNAAVADASRVLGRRRAVRSIGPHDKRATEATFYDPAPDVLDPHQAAT